MAVLFNGTRGFQVVGLWDSVEQAASALPDASPLVVLLDADLPGALGPAGFPRIHERLRGVHVVVLAGRVEEHGVCDALCSGASGYLRSDVPPGSLIESVRDVTRGGIPLSPEVTRLVVDRYRQLCPRPAGSPLSGRECDVLQALGRAGSYKVAASSLNISIDTLRFHVRHIYRKLSVNSRSEAVLRGVRDGVIR